MPTLTPPAAPQSLPSEVLGDLDLDFRELLHRRAFQRVSVDLSEAGALEKLDAIRLKYYNEVLSLDVQLKSLVDSELRDAQIGSERLRTFMQRLKDIHQKDASIHQLVRETPGLISQYSVIRHIYAILNNLMATKDQVSRLLKVRSQLMVIREVGDSGNLFEMHRGIVTMCEMRASFFEIAKNDHQRDEISRLFHGLDQMSQELRARLEDVISDHFQAAIDRPETLVRAMQVIDYASRHKSTCTHLPSEPFQWARDLCAAAIRGRFDSHFESVMETLSSAWSPSAGEDRSILKVCQSTIETTRVLIADLERVDAIAPVFPDRMAIAELTFLTYHRSLFLLFQAIAEHASTSSYAVVSVSLRIAKWAHRFWLRQIARLNAPPLSPPIVDVLVPLLAPYSEKIYGSMRDLTSRLGSAIAGAEVEHLEDRAQTMAPVMLFNLIQSVVDNAVATSSPALVDATFHQIKRVLLQYQDDFSAAFSREGLMCSHALLVAHLNDCDRCYEYTRDLGSGAAPPAVALDLTDVTEGFQNCIRMCRATFVRSIFEAAEETKEAVSALITAAEWLQNKGAPCDAILGSIADVLQDALPQLATAYHRRTVLEILEYLVQAYLLRATSGSGSLPPFDRDVAKQLEADAEAIEAFFATYAQPKDLVAARVLVLRDVSAMIVAKPGEGLETAFKQALEHAQDWTEALVNSVLVRRPDMDRKTLGGAIELWGRVYERFGPREPPQTGPFTRARQQVSAAATSLTTNFSSPGASAPTTTTSPEEASRQKGLSGLNDD